MKTTIFYNNKNVIVNIKNGVLGKECKSCSNFLEYTKYCTRFSDGKTYLMSSCKECNARKLKKSRKLNRELTLLSSCKHRATRQGLDFNLSIEDIVIPEFCPVLRIPLYSSSQQRTDNTPTVDRIDNSKGYTKDNIVVCSWRANKLKSDASILELKMIHDFVEKHFNE